MPLDIMVAEIMALVATTEPMERSMLPVMRITLCPIPTSRYFAMDRSRFIRLPMVRIWGLMMPKAMYSTIHPPKAIIAAPSPWVARSLLDLCVSVFIGFIPPLRQRP